MFTSLPGFREFYPERCAVRNHIFRVCRQTANRFGFQEYDAPILEPLELFTAKSGEEIKEQLFNFTDKGDREVALRPELTPSLARLVGAKANSMKRPIKWFAIGENFRYEKPQKGRLRSHYQFNADIFGEAGPAADAELIALLLNTFQSFSLTDKDIVLRLSDRTLWANYLESMGLDGEKALKVMSIIDKIEREDKAELIKKLSAHFGAAAEDFLLKVETLRGIRSLEDLHTFLLGHSTSPEYSEKTTARLTEWKFLLDSLEAMGLGSYVQIDLGIVRGLAYYTGFVFEVFDRSGEGRALAGGGRYDHLVAKLGYNDLPACGFGLGDVTLTDILESKGLLPAYIQKPDIFVVIGSEAERPAALNDVGTLRSIGLSVEYPFKIQNFGKQFKAANQSGARVALIYGGDEVAQQSVKVRDLQEGREKLIPASQLISLLPDILAEGLPED